MRDRHSQAASDSEMPVRMPSPFSRKSWLTDQSFTGLRLLRGCAGHSLHLLFGLPCGQMALPPHSLHSGFRLPCGQMLLPPQSLHEDLFLPCGQMLLPPHSLNCDLFLPCVQMPLPLHSLHCGLSLPWMQTRKPLPLHSLHLLRVGCLLCEHFFRGLGTLSTSEVDAGVAPADRHARLRQQWHRTTNNQTSRCCAMHRQTFDRPSHPA